MYFFSTNPLFVIIPQKIKEKPFCPKVRLQVGIASSSKKCAGENKASANPHVFCLWSQTRKRHASSIQEHLHGCIWILAIACNEMVLFCLGKSKRASTQKYKTGRLSSKPESTLQCGMSWKSLPVATSMRWVGKRKCSRRFVALTFANVFGKEKRRIEKLMKGARVAPAQRCR